MSDFKIAALWCAGTLAILTAAFAAGMFEGYQLGTRDGAEKIAEIQRQAEDVRNEQEKKLSEALAARDHALADARSLRADSSQLRNKLNARSADSLRKAADTGDGAQERLGRCEGLLAEGVGLAGEGAELSGRMSADKDALAAALK